MAPRRSRARRNRQLTNTGLDRAWQAMRIMREFTAPDIVAIAECNPTTLSQFMKAIQRAGYLVITHNKATRVHRPMGWRLVRDTGPLRPHVQTDRIVWDRNLGREFIPQEVPRG